MDKLQTLNFVFEKARAAGLIKTQKDFAAALGVIPTGLSKAFSNNPQNLTDNLISKVKNYYDTYVEPILGETQNGSLLVIPTSARGGTLGDFAESVKAYDCERMISPIKGADFAIQVTGDSMSPEYPSGSQIIIKKVDESAFIEWGKVYVLDTPNGAVIKKIEPAENEEEVRCISLNPMFQPFNVRRDFISGWYRVLMCLALK